MVYFITVCGEYKIKTKSEESCRTFDLTHAVPIV
jgi:hypothetical protein